MKKIPFQIQILLGMVLGLLYSWYSISIEWSDFTNTYLSPFGDLFIKLLKLLAVPIVLCSIITGIGTMEGTQGLGKMAFKMFALYMLSTLFAISIGMGYANFLDFNKKMDPALAIQNRLQYENFALSKNLDIYGTLISENPIHQEAFEQLQKQENNSLQANTSLQNALKNAGKSKQMGVMDYVLDMIPENIIVALSSSKMMIQVIFFALFLGIVFLFTNKKKTQVVMDFFEGINLIFLKMMDFVMRLAPFFVFCLMAGTFSKLAKTTADLWPIFNSLGYYTVLILSGFATLLFIVYPLFLMIFGRFSPITFFKGMKEAQMVGFSTSSSVATLPVSLKCVKENLGISDRIANFVLPIGATVNMDGTSLYQGAAVIFLAQFHGIDLPLDTQITVLFTTLLASIGVSGIPAAGLVLLIVILESVGLDPYWVAIIAPVDRLLDMIRTVINLTGDAMVAVIIGKTEKKIE